MNITKETTSNYTDYEAKRNGFIIHTYQHFKTNITFRDNFGSWLSSGTPGRVPRRSNPQLMKLITRN